MRGALDKSACDIDKLVRLPVEIDAGVRAAIEVSVNFFTFTHDEDVKRLSLYIQRKAPRLPVRNVVQCANVMQFRHVNLLP